MMIAKKGSVKDARKNTKILHIMRHGITEMNEYLHSNIYGGPNFRDPLLYDTKLSVNGRRGAHAAAESVKKLTLQPELLVVSPLRRAVQTAQCAWGSYDGPLVVEALARERVWLSSDIGRPPAQLTDEFQDGRFDFSHLPDCWWWNNGNSDLSAVHLEPRDVFVTRVRAFRDWLLQRPEQCIGVVSHWGVLQELTGHDFSNCELCSFELHDSPQDGIGHLRYWNGTNGNM